MCYRDNVPELDLQSVHVACLCGDNGHGKSALLDSITWALWGKSRARTHDELVHQGRSDMAVDLEFAAGAQRYRVSRRYSRRSSQGHTVLEFQVSSGNGFTPVTLNSVRETEEHIRSTLHMDYDTFVNTAFLLQGKADMFTASTPAKRKEVLAEVLDLAYYEALEERAKQRSREIQAQVERADTGVDLRAAEVARRDEHEEALAQVDARMDGLKKRAADAQSRHRRLEEAVTALRASAAELNTLERRISSAEEDMAEIARRIPDTRGRIEAAEELVGREDEILRGFENLAAARREVERLRDAALQAQGLEGGISGLDKAIAVERTRISGDRERVRSRIADDLEPAAARAPALETEIAAVEHEEHALDAAEADLEAQKDKIDSLTSERDALNSAMEKTAEIESRKARVEREIDVYEAQIKADIGHQSERARQLAADAGSLDALREQFGGLATEDSAVDAEAVEIDALRRSVESAAARMDQLNQANTDLRAEMDDTRRKFDILGDEATCPVCKHPLGPDGREHLKAELEQQGLNSKRRYAENRDELGRLESTHARQEDEARSRSAALEQRRRGAAQRRATLQERLQEAEKAAGELATAEAWLAELRANLATGSFASEERKRLGEIEEELAAVEYDPGRRGEIDRSIAALRNTVDAGQNELNRTRTDLRAKKAVLASDLENSKRAYEELEPQRRRLQELDLAISTEDYARAERRQVEALTASLRDLGYDPEEYRAARAAAADLGPYDELSRRLGEARDALPRERESLAADSRMLERRRSDIQADRDRSEELGSQVASMPARERELAEAGQARDSLESQVREASIEQGRLGSALERLDRLQAEIERLQAERKELADRKSIYDDLAVAFGRNGIQALMIENAIPQLQEDANELLGRLTENRMSIKLQVMEGRRFRGVASEELDIRISDEVGTRSYEMFSGGEAFRINFALRIALSKLLARRSGAPLPILFIDEGFGSLDAGGQEHLKEAIQSIQADFEKIIVITHVEQVKEAFPVRIEVTKTPAGSTFAIA